MNRRAPGFTLVELMVTVVVSAVLLTAVMQTVVVQQRTYREQKGVLDARQTMRTALELIGTELREISATDDDIYVATRDSIKFRAFRKVGVVCKPDENTNLIELWEMGDPFEVGDSALVFSEGPTHNENDDYWLQAEVAARGTAGSCGDQWPGYPLGALRLNPARPIDEVVAGSLVRHFVPVTYGGYTVDGESVVGRREENDPVVALIGPIAETGGLEFRYYRDDGQRFEPTTAEERRDIRRIEIVVRASRGGGGGSQPVVDSLVTQVRLRGNAWY